MRMSTLIHQLVYILILCLSCHGVITRAEAAGHIFKFGNNPETQQAYSGTPWTYGFAGDDWLGTDAAGKPWICLTGKQQSPVNLPATAGTSSTAIAPEHVTSWQLGTLTSNGSNIAVANNGHSVQLSWSDPAGAPKVMVVLQENSPWLSNLDLQRGNRVQTVTAVPQQLHWHAHSEHLVAGRMYPLEVHLVSVVPQSALPSCPLEGCTLVTAVLYELADGDMQANNTWLEPLFNIMPYVEGRAAFLPAGSQLDLQQLVPSDNTSYIAYAGSLTTPPCTEGVLWNVFLSPNKLSVQQWRAFIAAVGDYNCTLVNSTKLGTTVAPRTSPAGTAASPADVSDLGHEERDTTGKAHESNSSSSINNNNSSSSKISPSSHSRVTRLLSASQEFAPAQSAGKLPALEQRGRFKQQQQQQQRLQRSSRDPARSGSSATKQLLELNQSAVIGMLLDAAAGAEYVCSKLGAGQNYRLPQLLHGRVLRVWRDVGSGKKPLLPDDAAKAAGTGVVAGIVLGTVVGATLTGVVGFYAYKTYQRRRLKRLYNMAVSSNDMMMVQQEVESQWLREGAASSDHDASMGSSTATSSAQQLAARMSPRYPSAAVL